MGLTPYKTKYNKNYVYPKKSIIISPYGNTLRKIDPLSKSELMNS